MESVMADLRVERLDSVSSFWLISDAPKWVITHICSNGEVIYNHRIFIASQWRFLARTVLRPFLITVVSLCLVLASSMSASAQTISESQMRAANIARMQAELINGGSSQYSPANCMHQGGGETCMISNTADGFRFRFLGGGAGWAARREPATIETVILVSPDGKLSKVEYN
jgi:hypothetical protein